METQIKPNYRRTKWKKHNPGVSPTVHQQQRQLAKQQQKAHRATVLRTQNHFNELQLKPEQTSSKSDQNVFDTFLKSPFNVQPTNNLFFFNNDYMTLANSALLCASLGLDPSTASSSKNNPKNSREEKKIESFCID